MIEKMMKACGWITWASIMAMCYGFGWKLGWEMFFSRWNFQSWNVFDWIIFIPGIMVAHAGFALLALLGPIAIKRYVAIKNVKNNKT